jgi:hypothetical protein
MLPKAEQQVIRGSGSLRCFFERKEATTLTIRKASSKTSLKTSSVFRLKTSEQYRQEKHVRCIIKLQKDERDRPVPRKQSERTWKRFRKPVTISSHEGTAFCNLDNSNEDNLKAKMPLL